MKNWFPYEYGFVNIDENHVYLTNTGNWSEAYRLNEKSRENWVNWSKWKAIVFLTVVATFFVYLLVKALTGELWKLIFLIKISTLGYFVYRYMRTELGNNFKIPREKLEKIRIDGGDIEMYFLDADDREQMQLLRNVTSKGIQQMQELQDSIRV